MIRFFATLLGCLFVFAGPAMANEHFDFSLHKLEADRPGNTLLVIGGIQGDEPGGFNAASLLVTHYRIKKGNVWVVPNLNFISIIKRSRGVYGDLNRKFATIGNNDPEFDTISRIKEILLDDQVDMVLNLHDGSGFYRPTYVDRLHSPHRWGQSIIIDQKEIPARRFGNLDTIANKIVAEVNHYLFSEEHTYHVKNTKTREGDTEMERTLTYYAIRNRKPAFGVEVSKTFPTHKRAYYHLQVMEAYMDLLGIEYERAFRLSARGVRDAIKSGAKLAFYDNKIFLDVTNARKRLGYIPLKKASEIVFRPSSPLVAVVESGESYRVFHGNRRVTRLYPQYFEYDSSINAITIKVDGDERKINFGNMVEVARSFLVVPENGYRVNVIGFTKPGTRDESGIAIQKDDIKKRFSVDKKGRIYRIEVYREKKFSGMVLVSFSDKREDYIASDPSKVSLLTVSDLRNGPHENDSSTKSEDSSRLGR
ncbi:MAG: M99 family carboxypeptidase catalytic domain-containing protein [Syntrophobacterales bacterium]|jgi:hypothetical protein